MDKRVKDTLLTLGIRSTYQGFHYIKHALCLCLDDGDKIQSICKYIYPEVARKYQTSQDNVEHCMRTAIAYCWYNGNREYLIKIARYPLKENRLIASSLISCIMPLKVNPFHGFSFHPL